jgi:hypothetical protein
MHSSKSAISLSWMVCAFHPGLALNRSGQETRSDPAISSITYRDQDSLIRTPSLSGSGMPNHYIGDLLHTIAISGLSRVRTELVQLAIVQNPDATSSTDAPPASVPWLPWRSSVHAAWRGNKSNGGESGIRTHSLATKMAQNRGSKLYTKPVFKRQVFHPGFFANTWHNVPVPETSAIW